MNLRILPALALALHAAAAPVEILPHEFRGAVQPQVAVAPSGRIHVVFGKDNAVFHTTSLDGRAFSAPVKIGALEKLALKMRRGPRVTATDTLVLATAISHADGNVHAWTSADTGKTWQEGAPLNTVPNSAREGLQSLAGDGRGLVAAVWLDMRGEGTEPWSRVSRDGGATWAADVSIYQSPDGHICECCVPNVAISPTGEIAAMWRNWLGGSRDPWLAISADGGATFGEAKKLGAETWKLNGCPMDGGALAFSQTGKPLAVWRREKTVHAGEMGASEFSLAQNAAQPVVALGKSGAVFVWQQDGGLMIQRGTDRAARLADDAAFAAIASAADGGTAIVWETQKSPGTIYFDAQDSHK